MPRIEVTELDGQVITVQGREGETLMEALKNGGCDDIEAICGGACSCSTCHVYLVGGWFEASGDRNEGEQQLVCESGHFQRNSRLSCQVVLTAAMQDMRVVIAPPD
jgi:2Fe-2S ferredoxin